MTLTLLSPEDLLRFLFLTIRLSALFLTLPLFNSPHIPTPVKIVCTVALSLGFYPIVQQVPVVIPRYPIEVALLVLGELFLGMTIGFVAQLLFAGIQIGGELIGVHMGMSIATLFNPHETQQISVISFFQYIIAILIFLSGAVYQWFFQALAESLHTIPLLGVTVTPAVVMPLVTLVGQAFIAALQLAAPVTVALLLATIALGIMVRLVPQLNVFILSFPLTFGFGLLVMTWTLPYLLSGLRVLFIQFGKDLIQVIHLLGTT